VAKADTEGRGEWIRGEKRSKEIDIERRDERG
jgi:hypothetical protein